MNIDIPRPGTASEEATPREASAGYGDCVHDQSISLEQKKWTMKKNKKKQAKNYNKNLKKRKLTEWDDIIWCYFETIVLGSESCQDKTIQDIN